MKLQRVWALLAVLLLIGSLTGCENKTELVAVEREPVAEQTEAAGKGPQPKATRPEDEQESTAAWLGTVRHRCEFDEQRPGRPVVWMDLYTCRVTDAELRYLQGMIGLEWLDLNSTGVTDEGVKELQKALPKCRITHYEKPHSLQAKQPETGRAR
jgi:hypothetical protein